MGKSLVAIPNERIERSIFLIGGQKVMLDADLADLYGVATKRLNEQVKRNPGRFPEDFMLQLTLEEKPEVVANCDRLARLRFSSALPCCLPRKEALSSLWKREERRDFWNGWQERR